MFSIRIPHSEFRTPNFFTSAPGGNRTHIATEGGRFTGDLAAHRASEGVARFRGSSTSGSRTHIPRGLSSGALPVGVSCHFLSSRFQVPGSRFQVPGSNFQVNDCNGLNLKPGTWNLELKSEPPVGIEPTLRPYQGRKLPLHHRGISNAECGTRNGESRQINTTLKFRIPHSAFHNSQSAQWESNPHIRHGKAAGSRYIMGASLKFQVPS
jgi:hypothetical protein